MPLPAEVNPTPCGNCYQMCFSNAKNIVYQNGRVSWYLSFLSSEYFES